MFENKIEKGFGSREQQLSNDEALAFQDYATKKDGIEFSKKADENSYLEAERLLEKLKDKKFDWLDIQWDKVDLSAVGQYKEIIKIRNDSLNYIYCGA